MGTVGQAANSVVSSGYDNSGDVTSVANGIAPTNPQLKGAANQSIRYDAVRSPSSCWEAAPGESDRRAAWWLSACPKETILQA